MTDTKTESPTASGAAPLLGVWVVVAYRYGMRDAHSYVVGAYSNEDAANAAARGECEYRGGKYGCEVVACPLADSYVEGVQTPEQSHYVESPYHGMLGDGYHPADLTSNERKQKALLALERRKTPNSVVNTNSVCSLTPETPRKDKPNQ